jgi:hypothetical protein
MMLLYVVSYIASIVCSWTCLSLIVIRIFSYPRIHRW